MSRTKFAALAAVLCSFFVMGFVDIVTIATSYVKQDFALSDTWANLLPLMVFFWFAVISIPTGVLLGKLGRRNTVLLSAAVTTLGMLLPVVSYTLPVIMMAFILLGVGNTILQVSLNPLMMSVVPLEQITSKLTLGQFIKAISSFLGPLIVGFASAKMGNWQLIFPIYAAITVVSFVWLFMTPIEEEKENSQKTSAGKIFALLRDKNILIYFSVIILIVGYEVGLMTAMPKYLLERLNMPLESGGMANSLYFAARTIGMLTGTILLAKVSSKRFFIVTMILAVTGYAVMMLTGSISIIYGGLFLVGLAAANVFAIAFSLAMRHDPSKANEISALMITGIAGGALIPPIMGLIADFSNQFVSLLLPFACLIYILFVAIAMNAKKTV